MGKYITDNLCVLTNALILKSTNQLRMYELLKQYENIGKREFDIDDLRELLGIKPDEYSRWNNFKARVLDSCQQALAEKTDISFTYAPGKKGAGGKWLTIIFFISVNKNHVDKMKFEEFLNPQVEPQTKQLESYSENVTDDEISKSKYSDKNIAELASACGNEFDENQMKELFSLIASDENIRSLSGNNDKARFLYLSQQYARLNSRVNRKNLKPVNDRFGYLIKIIENDIKARAKEKAAEEKHKITDRYSTDVNSLELLALKKYQK